MAKLSDGNKMYFILAHSIRLIEAWSTVEISSVATWAGLNPDI